MSLPKSNLTLESLGIQHLEQLTPYIGDSNDLTRFLIGLDSSDSNLEHARYAFFNWLTSRQGWSKPFLDALLQCLENDDDAAMASAVVIDVLESLEVDSWVFARLEKSSLVDSKAHVVEKLKIQKQLLTAPLAELVSRCLEFNHGELQYQLMEKRELSKESLLKLKEGGANKKVRNAAGQKLDALEK